jgi:hypothetical protein
MKKQLVTLLATLSLSPLASFALNADQAPACPAPASLKNYSFVYAKANEKLGWAVFSDKIDDTFIGTLVDVYEPTVTTKDEAMTQAAAIVQPATTTVENKIYFQEDHKGPYIWACYYDMPASSLGLGDGIITISKEFNENGSLAAVQHTLAEKVALIRNAK